MKYSLLRFIVLICLFINCKQKKENYISNEDQYQQQNSNVLSSTEKCKELITEFYSKYYSNNVDRKGLENYVSSRILNRMDSLSEENNLILDYDPFIKGQDYDWSTIKKTLVITPLKNKNEFRVSFFLFDEKNEEKTIIDLLLKEDENRKFLIYSILNDEYLNFNSTKKGINENNIESTNSSSNNNSLKGNWSNINCDDPRGLDIKTSNELLICVEPNIFYIHLLKIDNSTDHNIIKYKLKEVEGIGMQDIETKNIFNDKEVAIIKILNNKKIEFNWLGFYDEVNKSRRDKINPISFKGNNPIILTKCEE
ncbi:DUF3828 domain-containing protein [Chryseobacterium sp. 2TAF14]|uniref:DUF3828 domain-containing protein n=1 Tax=Chryseobacterium sp. 2TAF14 TaxID=3233007 RepID=UPI003F908832